MSTWTIDRHNAAQKRCDAATEEPWVIQHCELLSVVSRKGLDYTTELEVCDCVGEEGNPQVVADTTFICHARTDLPDALAVIEQLKSDLDEAVSTAESALSLCDVYSAQVDGLEKLCRESLKVADGAIRDVFDA